MEELRKTGVPSEMTLPAAVLTPNLTEKVATSLSQLRFSKGEEIVANSEPNQGNPVVSEISWRIRVSN